MNQIWTLDLEKSKFKEDPNYITVYKSHFFKFPEIIDELSEILVLNRPLFPFQTTKTTSTNEASDDSSSLPTTWARRTRPEVQDVPALASPPRPDPDLMPEWITGFRFSSIWTTILWADSLRRATTMTTTMTWVSTTVLQELWQVAMVSYSVIGLLYLFNWFILVFTFFLVKNSIFNFDFDNFRLTYFNFLRASILRVLWKSVFVTKVFLLFLLNRWSETLKYKLNLFFFLRNIKIIEVNLDSYWIMCFWVFDVRY